MVPSYSLSSIITMKAYKNLILIGTSHIAKQSMHEVKAAIAGNKPAVVCVELDEGRFYGLINNKRSGKISIRDIGLSGYLFARLGSFVQKHLGKIVDLEPGSEMLAAVHASKDVGAKIALIDQDIQVTLRNLHFTWRDAWNMLSDTVRGIIQPKKEAEKLGIKNLDLRKVPPAELVEKLILRVKERHPGIYKALISDRDRFMAHRLYRIMQENEKSVIVAVVGAGHEPGIIANLERLFGSGAEISYRFSLN